MSFKENIISAIKKALDTHAIFKQEKSDSLLIILLLQEAEETLNEFSALVDELNGEEEQAKKALIEFLANRWQQIRRTVFGYTTLPHHYITELFVDVAKQLQAIDNQKLYLQYLMPDLQKVWTPKKLQISPIMHQTNIFSVEEEDTPTLDEFSLSEILLSDEMTTIIPVRYLLQLSYRDLEWNLQHEEILRSKGVLERLRDYSEHTKIWLEAFEAAERANLEQLTIKEALEKLIKALREGGAYNGGGTDTLAGMAAMFGIRSFGVFLNTLPNDTQKKLNQCKTSTSSLGLHDFEEIFNILTKGTRPLASCVETNASILERIIDNPDNKQFLEQKFSKNKKEIALKNFNVMREYGHSEGQERYRHLPQKYQKNLVSLFNRVKTIEQFIKFASQFEIEDIQAELPKKLSTLIQNKQQLYDLLISLDASKYPIIFAALNLSLSHILANVMDLSFIIRFLNDTPRNHVLEALKNYLPKIITDYHQLTCILKFLNETQCRLVFTAIKNNLTKIIADGWQLGSILQSLNDLQRGVVLEILRENLATIIKNAHELSCVLQVLNETQFRFVLIALKKDLSKIIADGYQLGHILESLDDLQRDITLQILKEHLTTIIKNGGLAYVLKPLNDAHRNFVLKILEDHLLEIITKNHGPGDVLKNNDLADILESTNDIQHNFILEKINNHLSVIIENYYQLIHILKPLNETNRHFVLTTIKKDLSKIIINGNELANVLQLLNDAQRDLILELLRKFVLYYRWLQSTCLYLAIVK